MLFWRRVFDTKSWLFLFPRCCLTSWMFAVFSVFIFIATFSVRSKKQRRNYIYQICILFESECIQQDYTELKVVICAKNQISRFSVLFHEFKTIFCVFTQFAQYLLKNVVCHSYLQYVLKPGGPMYGMYQFNIRLMQEIIPD